MSEVKDRFFERLLPILDSSFEFKPSKGQFLKTQDGLQFLIGFRWDGRGGTSMIDEVNASITSLAVDKAVKKLTGAAGIAHAWLSVGNCGTIPKPIPVMYSRRTLDLANAMNFKELAKLAFDEKYPPERIQGCVAVVADLINQDIAQFFKENGSEAAIYQRLCDSFEKEPIIEQNSHNLVLLLKLYAKKLGLPEPPRLQGYTAYIDQYKFALGYLGKVDFDKLEHQLANYRFD